MHDELIKTLRLRAALWEKMYDEDTVLKQAADAIEQLSKPRWIPVTERLPEKYHQVLVYGLNGMQIDYYAGEKSIGGRPLFMISEAKVTYWQPLPEPPKEET